MSEMFSKVLGCKNMPQSKNFIYYFSQRTKSQSLIVLMQKLQELFMAAGKAPYLGGSKWMSQQQQKEKQIGSKHEI